MCAAAPAEDAGHSRMLLRRRKAQGLVLARMNPYYEHGGITIFHGDCLEILPQLPWDGADMVLADPPYAISVSGSRHVRASGEGSRTLDFFEGDADWPAQRRRVQKALVGCVNAASPTASWYVWCGHRQMGDVVDYLESWGLKTRPYVWVKTCPAPAPPGSGWASAVELCVYAYPAGRTWNMNNGLHSNVVHADSFRHGNPDKLPHPTQKPISLVARQIEASSNLGDLILDPFMGSGTTLRAAKDLGRRAIGIEIEERYCEIAAKRLGQEVMAFE